MNEKLKDLRDYHGISQRELARRIGVGKTTISEIERGDRLPNVLTAYGGGQRPLVRSRTAAVRSE